MFESQRRRSFPLPDYDMSTAGQVSVSIPGRILDERYTRVLMEHPGLSLAQVMALDRIQKGLAIDRSMHQRLKAAGLVEGRFPDLIVAAQLAKATGNAARHILERGFGKSYYLDLILALVAEHGPVGRAEIDQLLMPRLPERLSTEQKRRKVQNLMQELRRDGRITNLGERARPQWALPATGIAKSAKSGGKALLNAPSPSRPRARKSR
jgi:ATP-dependent DNA helicase RecG